MPSTFSWLDGSERQRRQMRELLSQFEEKGTRDELGLAPIRDALADLLFPGTGTLQTRARYFFFVPWIYQELERKKVPSSEVAARARRVELDLIEVLVDSGEKGTIGERARRQLQRLPSNIYWAGLARLGVLSSPISQESYHQKFESYSSSRALRDDDGDVIAAALRAWHPKLPEASNGFPKQATFELTRDEAEFLQDQIQQRAAGSFFAWWLDRPLPGEDEEFAWFAVDAALPERLARQVRHARNFSELAHGVSILYTLLLTRVRGSEENGLVGMFDDWYARTAERRAEIDGWDLSDFWLLLADTGARIGSQTQRFVRTWREHFLAAEGSAALREDAESKRLIVDREVFLKRSLARFSNRRARELWGGASGLSQFDFRWRKAAMIRADIARGLKGR